MCLSSLIWIFEEVIMTRKRDPWHMHDVKYEELFNPVIVKWGLLMSVLVIVPRHGGCVAIKGSIAEFDRTFGVLDRKQE